MTTGAQLAQQVTTKRHAGRAGQAYTEADRAALASGEPLHIVALQIGRSLSAVHTARRTLGLAESVPQRGTRHAERPVLGAVCPDHFIAGCDCRD